LIEMRRRLLEGSRAHASWRPVADDLAGLLREWFNGGLLELRRIDNGSAPRLLEHVVQYEAVHTIHNALELHRRLEPDRRCFGLFHSALGDEPLAFTEIALTAEMSAEVPPLLDPDSAIADPAACRCAIFYSISSCHDGLRGVSFGNLLIRRAVDALRRELPHLRLFATLSPIPGFRAWLREAARAGDDVAAIAAKAGDSGELDRNPDLRRDLIALCASYLLFAKRGREAADPVARFHLGNGARLERLNWMGDGSPVGMQRSFGLTANYVYSLADVDRNHIEYESGGRIAASHRVELLAASAPL
jgi:malonyl-CoA decarboxylase